MSWLDSVAARLQRSADKRRRSYQTPGQRLADAMGGFVDPDEQLLGAFLVASRSTVGGSDLGQVIELFRAFRKGPVRWSAFAVTREHLVEFDLGSGLRGLIKRRPVRLRRRLPLTAFGPITGTLDYQVEIAGSKWWVPLQMVDDAKGARAAGIGTSGWETAGSNRRRSTT